MPCRHGETGIRNRLKIGLFGLRVRFPLAALSETRLGCRVFLFFQRFRHGLQFTAIHSNSLQLPEECGQNVGTESEVHVLSHVGFDLGVFLRRADSQQPHGIVLALNIALAKAFDESCGFEFFGDLAYAVVGQLLALRIARLIPAGGTE